MLSGSDRGLAHAPGRIVIRHDAARRQFDNTRYGYTAVASSAGSLIADEVKAGPR